MAMVQMTGALPGGLSGAMATGMPTNGMVNGVPPSPGANNNFAGSSPAQMQQKMLRQRQLALERRRIAGRHASGGMAQANSLPVDNLYSKAPGWDRVLGEGIEKPGSLAEKAEQAFQHKKGPTVVKSINSLPSVDEKAEEVDQAPVHSSRSNNDLQSKPKRVSTRSGTGSGDNDEIEVCDIIDSVLLEAPKTESHRGAPPQSDATAGWNLHVEHQPAAAPPPAGDTVTVTAVSAVAPKQDATEQSGRRWYKPWQRAPKPAPAPAPPPVVEKKPTVEETAVSAFSMDRHSISTPDSITDMNSGASSMAWGGGARGGAAARRGRRPSPESEDTDLQFMGEMMAAPGVIEERPSVVSPVQQRPKVTHQQQVAAPAPASVTSVQPFSNENARPESKTTDSGITPFARPRRDEVAEVQAFRPDLDEMSDVGDRPARPDRQRPSREPGWNSQVDSPGEPMARKRFWKPFGSSKPPPPSGNSASSVESTMVCAFDG